MEKFGIGVFVALVSIFFWAILVWVFMLVLGAAHQSWELIPALSLDQTAWTSLVLTFTGSLLGYGRTVDLKNRVNR